MKECYQKYLTDFEFNPPAARSLISKVESELGLELPNQYTEYILISNGGEGSIGNCSYLALWSIEELIHLNNAYEVNEFAPGLLLFGSNAGLDAYAFDTRNSNMPIVEVPFIGMNLAEIKHCGDSFVEFLEYLFNKE